MALAFAAANISFESGEPGAASANVESLEAQEIRVSKTYQNALQLIHEGCTEEAQVQPFVPPYLQLDLGLGGGGHIACIVMGYGGIPLTGSLIIKGFLYGLNSGNEGCSLDTAVTHRY